jgi:hypothetical protein
MRLTRPTLDEAVNAGLLDAKQAAALWDFLQHQEPVSPSFKPAHILYYLGGLIAMGAMPVFLSLGWERLGGGAVMAIALAYCAVATLLTEWLLARHRLAIPAGIAATFAVVMVPVAVLGVQQLWSLWAPEGAAAWIWPVRQSDLDGRLLMMQCATLLAAGMALWRYRLPFLVMPVALTLWFISMDLTRIFMGAPSFVVFSRPGDVVSVCLGVVITVLAVYVDVRFSKTKDFAFWLYLLGVLSFWCGLCSLVWDSHLHNFLYACVNLLLIAMGAALSRRVFAVVGAIGVASYLGYVSHTLFAGSLLFPVALTLLGLAVVVAGVVWQRHEAAWGERLRGFLPEAVRALMTQRSA